MTMITLMLAAALAVQPDETGMFPFLIRPDAADTAADMSALLPKPAGRDGFIRRDGEHFVDGKGRIVRMNGVNFTAAANFPEHADADRTADELARLGFNCVRMHLVEMAFYANNFIDPQYCLCPTDANGKHVFDESKRDKMEYLIAALKKRGIFIDMNLHAGRELGPADGYRRTCWANRGVSFFDKAFFDAECDYARNVLTHVNPYTGLRMADDPAMSMVEINNENALMQVYWSNTLPNQGADPWFLEEFDRQRKAAGFGATTNEINRFIVQTEQKYFRAMRDYLRNELGVKCVIYGSQLDYTAPWAYKDMDAIDVHIYWNHPGWIDDAKKKRPNGEKRRNPDAQWTVRNVPLVDAELTGDYDNPIMFRGARRVKGQPFITTECATPYPCWYGADFQPIIHAYASFQDWAGVFTYSWNNETNSFPSHIRSFFSMMCRSDVLAHLPASAALFLRGDAAKAKERVEVAADREKIYAEAEKAGRYTPLVLCDASSKVYATNCLFAANTIENWGAFKLGGKDVRLELVNCTVAANKTTSSTYCGGITGDGASDGRATVRFLNTVFWDNTANGVVKNFLDSYLYTDFEFDNSCFTGIAPTSGAGNTASDPDFADPAGGDFRLGENSSCIDTGADLPAVPVDLDGRERPIDGTGGTNPKWDIGCYEAAAREIPVQCSLKVLGSEGTWPCPMTQTVTVVGSRLTGLSYEWLAIRMENGVPVTNRQVTAVAENVFEGLPVGVYSFVCTVSNDRGDAASSRVDDAFTTLVGTCYVSNEGSDTFPYTNAATAARNLSSAISVASERIVIAPGEYQFDHYVDEQTGYDTMGAVYRAVAIEAGASGVRGLFMPDGDLWFDVRKDAAFGFFAGGSDEVEGFAAELFDSDGKSVWKNDAVTAWDGVTGKGTGGLWRVRLGKPAKGAWEDAKIALEGGDLVWEKFATTQELTPGTATVMLNGVALGDTVKLILEIDPAKTDFDQTPVEATDTVD